MRSASSPGKALSGTLKIDVYISPSKTAIHPATCSVENVSSGSLNSGRLRKPQLRSMLNAEKRGLHLLDVLRTRPDKRDKKDCRPCVVKIWTQTNSGKPQASKRSADTSRKRHATAR